MDSCPGQARVSVVVPVLNDAGALSALAALLAPWQTAEIEIIVVDGGSSDETPGLMAALTRGAAGGGFRLISAARGRGAQLAAGIEVATGDWIWMLHADSSPSSDCLSFIRALDGPPAWGRFAVRLDGPRLLGLVALLMNARSCLTGICTGDQGIFVHRRLLVDAGGMPAQPLMEDIEISRRLKRRMRPRCQPQVIGTSARRWRQRGVTRTILSMWCFRLRYWLGADPATLAREYYR